MDRVLIFEDILTAIDAAAPKPVPDADGAF